MKLRVCDLSVASFLRWGGAEAGTIDAWTGFTDNWLDRNAYDASAVAWIPRIPSGGLPEFDAAVEDAYPELPRGIAVTRAPEAGSKLGGNASEAAETWPVLYVNPWNESMVGFDIGSDAVRARAIELMLASNRTSVSERVVARDGRWALFVLQPVFGGGNRSGEIVGCSMLTVRIGDLLLDALAGSSFQQRYPAASLSVSLRVGPLGSTRGADSGGYEDQLLFELSGSGEGGGSSGGGGGGGGVGGGLAAVSPGAWSSSSSEESITWVAALTASKAIVFESSFAAGSGGAAGAVVLLLGCFLSALLSGLIWRKQALLLRYKEDMEEARARSGTKTEFVANTSHEIRTMLNGIIGTGELLADQALPPAATELLGIMQSCSRILMDT